MTSKKSLDMKRTIVFLFVLIFVNSANAQYIFNVDVEIVNPEKVFYPGKNLIVNADIKSLGITQDRIDVKLDYKILDYNGNIITERESTVAIHTSLKTTEIFSLPKNIKEGTYAVIVRVEDGDYSSSGSQSFYVESRFLAKLSVFVSENPVLFGIILFLSILSFILMLLWVMHTTYRK